MSFYKNLLLSLPEVSNPIKKGSLKTRMMWTFGMLVLFLFLASVPLFGVLDTQAQYFKTLELLLGAKIGMLLTLGIGPIVTASIVLQLLKGSGILKFDMDSEEGKFIYAGTHKLLTFAFIIIEGFVYVIFGAVTPAATIPVWLVSIQLMMGGFLVFYMDEVVKKWGIGSGVSLFIAAGIGAAVFIQLFSPFAADTTAGASAQFAWPFGDEVAIGALWSGLYYISNGDMTNLFFSVLGPVGITIALFFLITFFQSVNVEIPLSFGRVRGQSMKWPLNFFYSGVIPVILVSALGANFQMWARLLQSMAEKADSSAFVRFISEHVLGQFQGTSPVSGLVNWIYPIGLWENWGNFFTLSVWPHMLSYIIYLVVGSTLFAYFWVQTSGMDSRSQAKQIINSGLQIPGFRKDIRIIEKILDRYIVPLTIMGGIGIGLLASSADILAALTSGTGILLLIMIIYQFYKQLARESMEDFSLLRKLMRK
ncbi:MAG: preprotein translocase subunit SecY [Nanoarchaeota archaeon]|nr:preprotein translocase subunit SecY [Nanoarchaeota archaeon]